MSTGCQWRALPKALPPRRTLCEYRARWEAEGTLRRIQAELYGQWREQAWRSPSPTAGIIDRQRGKSTDKGGVVWTHRAMTRANRSRGKRAMCEGIRWG